ncbi:hypothetical protein SRHO_G00248470 [Serrasalmus rhombeus]
MADKLAEVERKILELTTKSKKHKTASLNAQRTCKKLQQSLTEVEQLHANCKPKRQCRPPAVAPPPGQPCTEEENLPVLHRLYPDLDAFHSDGSESSLSLEYVPLLANPRKLNCRPGKIKAKLISGGERWQFRDIYKGTKPVTGKSFFSNVLRKTPQMQGKIRLPVVLGKLLNCKPKKTPQLTSTQTSASKTLTIVSPPAPVSEMERSRAVLIALVCALFSRISGAEVEMMVRPGDDVTLYSDCVWKSGFSIVWFRNSSCEHQPPLMISTHDLARRAFPRYSAVWNPSNQTNDLLVKNVSDSDVGLYYCAMYEKNITKDKKGVLHSEDIYHYGKRTTRLSLLGKITHSGLQV